MNQAPVSAPLRKPTEESWAMPYRREPRTDSQRNCVPDFMLAIPLWRVVWRDASEATRSGLRCWPGIVTAAVRTHPRRREKSPIRHPTWPPAELVAGLSMDRMLRFSAIEPH